MSCKNPLLGNKAVGYWGGSPRTIFDATQTPDRILALHIDKIRTLGLPYLVWREATSLFDNPVKCSCWKDTSKQPDIPCLSCYGTGYLPGFLKFGTQNYWKSSIDTDWTLTNLVLDKTNRPFRLMLDQGQLSGTAVSPNININTTSKVGAWESRIEAFTRDAGAASAYTVEVSKDSGVTWVNISALETLAPTTTIMFKVTLSRTLVTGKSPMFEMIRIRFNSLTDQYGTMSEPVVRLIPTWDIEQEIRNNFGSKMEISGKRFWTVPLNFFDATITPELFTARLADDVFVECRYGGEIGMRYALNEFRYSDTFSKFTRQEFALRRYAGDPNKLDGEFAYRVF